MQNQNKTQQEDHQTLHKNKTKQKRKEKKEGMNMLQELVHGCNQRDTHAMHIHHFNYVKKKQKKFKTDTHTMKIKHKRPNLCRMHKMCIDDHITKNLRTTQNTQTLKPPRNFTQKKQKDSWHKRIMMQEQPKCRNICNARIAIMQRKHEMYEDRHKQKHSCSIKVTKMNPQHLCDETPHPTKQHKIHVDDDDSRARTTSSQCLNVLRNNAKRLGPKTLQSSQQINDNKHSPNRKEIAIKITHTTTMCNDTTRHNATQRDKQNE